MDRNGAMLQGRAREDLGGNGSVMICDDPRPSFLLMKLAACQMLHLKFFDLAAIRQRFFLHLVDMLHGEMQCVSLVGFSAKLAEHQSLEYGRARPDEIGRAHV